MRNWIAFILAAFLLILIHESTHALVAMPFNEFNSFHIRPLGFEVVFQTPVADRQGIHWSLISGLSNLITILLGYVLLILSSKFVRLDNVFFKVFLYYLTFLALIVDPLNLSIGPYFYGGDASGIAAGLGINRWIIQVIFFVFLFINRELIAQWLIPIYEIKQTHFLLKPLITHKKV